MFHITEITVALLLPVSLVCPRPKGFDLIREDRAHTRGGGVGIAVSNRLRYRKQGNLLD
jgi:hypothetical protein